MNVFVSSQRVDASFVQALIQHLRYAGFAVDHSPRNPLDGEDSRWNEWYETGLPTAVSAADCFVIVIDYGWDSATWMGIEADLARLSNLPMYFWNPQGIEGIARGMLSYLKTELPADLTLAVRCLTAHAETEQ